MRWRIEIRGDPLSLKHNPKKETGAERHVKPSSLATPFPRPTTAVFLSAGRKQGRGGERKPTLTGLGKPVGSISSQTYIR